MELKENKTFERKIICGRPTDYPITNELRLAINKEMDEVKNVAKFCAKNKITLKDVRNIRYGITKFIQPRHVRLFDLFGINLSDYYERV